MGIIDRYLLRKYVQTFVICFLSLFGLFVLIELSTNLDKFLQGGEKAGEVLRFIGHYYAFRAVLFFDRVSGLLALISAMFTVSWIQRHNEMTALMAAGVSRIRVLIPLVIAVGVISVLSTINREVLIPRYRNELARRPQDPLGDQPQSLESRYDGQTDVLLGGKNTYASQKRIEEPDFRLPLRLSAYGKQLSAANAYYQPATGDRPAGYLMDGVHEPKNLDSRPSLLLSGRPVLITPHDAPQWLKPDQCFLVSDVSFDQLAGGTLFKQLSSTAELMRGLRNPSADYGADVRTTIHARIIQPVLDITLLFLGLPLIVTRESRNVFIAMGICLAVNVAFMLVVFASQQMGAISFWIFTPSLAAWTPLLIFVPVAVWLSESLWK